MENETNATFTQSAGPSDPRTETQTGPQFGGFQKPSFNKPAVNAPDKAMNIAGIIGGAITIIIAFVVVFYSPEDYEAFCRFGGDFYTEIHAAVSAVFGLLKIGMFGLLLSLGIAEVCHFGAKLKSGSAAKEKTLEDSLPKL